MDYASFMHWATTPRHIAFNNGFEIKEIPACFIIRGGSEQAIFVGNVSPGRFAYDNDNDLHVYR